MAFKTLKYSKPKNKVLIILDFVFTLVSLQSSENMSLTLLED